MGKKEKPGIGERIIHALTWWRHPKEKHHDVPDESNKNTSVFSSSRNTEDVTPTSSLRFSLTRSTKESVGPVPMDVSTHGSMTGENVQFPVKYRAPTQLTTEVTPTISSTPPDQTDFFSFLDDVIAGKHNELLQEMNQKGTPTPSNNGSRLVETSSIPETFSEKVTPQPQQKTSTDEGETLEGSQYVPTKPPKGLCSSAARTLMNYELMAYLGRGTFAEVTLARQKDTHKLFALKKISKKKVREEGCVQHTFTERQLLASLKHPFLVGLHQAFQSRTHLYLVLDFAQGGDFYFFLEKKPWIREMRHKLHKLCRTNSNMKGSSLKLSSLQSYKKKITGRARSASLTQLNEIAFTPQVPDDSRTPIRFIAFYAVEIALVLQYLHEQGFIYRDLKPENILMMRNGHLVLTDFGVAKYRGIGTKPSKTGSDRQNSFTGTTQYMSPEMLLGQPHDNRIDWWSFGCLLFEMATGRQPFAADNQYAVVQSIVENDVCVRPDDFLLTGLEVDMRVMQLHRRHRAYQRAVLRDMTSRACNDTFGDENGLQLCDLLTGPTMSTAGSTNIFLGATPITGNNPSLRNESRLGIDESFSSAGPDTSYNYSTMSVEENSHFLRYAVQEMEEASMLLRDLILLLLERRPERRLSGISVLEHPFFSCTYVTSELYYKAPCVINEDKSSGLTSNKSGKNSMDHKSFHTRVRSEGCSFAVKQMKSISSITTSLVGTNDNDDKDDDVSDNSNGGSFVSQMLQKHLSAEFFLSLDPYERPKNWRELFLKKKIKPPFIPRLLAADDLRYFPAAVTATGDSIMVQQRKLREQTRRRNENLLHSFECENVSSSFLPVHASTANPTTNTDDSVDEGADVLRASLSSFTMSEDESEEPLQPMKTSGLASLSERGNVAGNQNLEDVNDIPFTGLDIPFHDSVNTTVPTSSLLSSTPFVSSNSGSAMHYLSSTVRDEFKYQKEAGKSEDKGFSRKTSPSTFLLPFQEKDKEIAKSNCTGLRKNKSETIETKNPPITSLGYSTQKESVKQDGDKMSARTNLPVDHMASETLSPRTQDDGLPKKSSFYFAGEMGGESSSSLFSQTTTDEEEGILFMAPCSGETLPDTLRGVAYDVDDYLPIYYKKNAAVLKSSTGIPTGQLGKVTGIEETLLEKEKVSEASVVKERVAADLCDITEKKIEISDNQQDDKPNREKITTSLIFATESEPAAPTSAQRGNVTNNCFTTLDTRRPSNISLCSPEFISSASQFSSKGAAEVVGTREGKPVQNPNMAFGASTQAGEIDECASSQCFDYSPLFSTGGGQHYLGFTFDACNGHALLLGGMGNSGTDTGAFSDMT
ncbi:Protein kinase domain [Trypanosoma melophagium]|uniref:Protein kinase domain n=1 Tax=Trypanosoma melophagium TaxID=715481 RepID=UPI003519DC22|nr:Protein kinase domain [Trypanosoma melophagium]